eukprot:365072-Chlamydomonas_euryale.AAC.2
MRISNVPEAQMWQDDFSPATQHGYFFMSVKTRSWSIIGGHVPRKWPWPSLTAFKHMESCPGGRLTVQLQTSGCTAAPLPLALLCHKQDNPRTFNLGFDNWSFHLYFGVQECARSEHCRGADRSVV